MTKDKLRLLLAHHIADNMTIKEAQDYIIQDQLHMFKNMSDLEIVQRAFETELLDEDESEELTLKWDLWREC